LRNSSILALLEAQSELALGALALEDEGVLGLASEDGEEVALTGEGGIGEEGKSSFVKTRPSGSTSPFRRSCRATSPNGVGGGGGVAGDFFGAFIRAIQPDRSKGGFSFLLSSRVLAKLISDRRTERSSPLAEV
jgi:hypothetical protein